MKTRETLATRNLTLHWLRPLWLFVGLIHAFAPFVIAQEPPPLIIPEDAGKIIIETRPTEKPPVFHSAKAQAAVQVLPNRIEQEIRLEIHVIQGDAETLSIGINGNDEITAVEADQIDSWAVRREGKSRFLDLKVKAGVKELRPLVRLRSPEFELPGTIALTHLTPGKSVGFNSVITLKYAPGVEGKVIEVPGFNPLDTKNQFQTSSGGILKIQLAHSGALAKPVELTDSQLTGKVDPTGKFVEFQLRGTANVTENDASLILLQGNAAASRIGQGFGYRLKLTEPTPGQPVYELVFDGPGRFPVELDFVAPITESKEWRAVDFSLSAGAVVPLNLLGLGTDVEFRETTSVVPVQAGDSWRGFLPANGHLSAAWKSGRKAGEGKLFFATTATVESSVGAGLLRQNHRIDYKILQGELDSLTYTLDGPGEILAVEGQNIIGWKVEAQRLLLSLSQPITGNAQIDIRTQTALDAFPVRLDPLRITPDGAVRHSGFIRLTNQGSVRLEPTSLTGLTQLAPDQFPGGAVQARQIFVYRFPAADFDYEVMADRIQPEINLSQITIYHLAETDRVITTDVELDIREAPLREFDIVIPADYSVVAATGASVGDYVVGTQTTDGQRNLKIIFAQDVSGRHLINLHLEKNESAAAGDWVLPRLSFPAAKSVRGDIGVVGAPGFRIGVSQVDLLAEKPLSYFPKSTPNLQQAFRIRERDWQAFMNVEILEKSVQADVFHLYSLNNRTAYASVLLNYFVTGAPVSEWKLTVPAEFGNVMVDGQDVRTWRREDDTLFVSLHQPVIGSHTLLVTYEEQMTGGTIQPGRVAPIDVLGERGFIHVVSPVQVETEATPSENLLELDALELPAEFRLLTSAPPLETYQYTSRPFSLSLSAKWFEPGETVTQVVEFSEVSSRVSADGELVTDISYFVKSRGQQALRVVLPNQMRLWKVSVSGQSVSARQDGDATLIPLPAGTDPNLPVEVKLGLAKPAQPGKYPLLQLPSVFAPVLKTVWKIHGETGRKLVPVGGTVEPPKPVLIPRGISWIAQHGLVKGFVIGALLLLGITLCRKQWILQILGMAIVLIAVGASLITAEDAYRVNRSANALELNLPILASEDVVELQVRNVSPLWANLSIPGIVLAAIGIGLATWSLIAPSHQRTIRAAGILMIAFGLLLQRGGAPWFFGLLGLLTFLLVFVPHAWKFCQTSWQWWQERRRRKASKKPPSGSPEPDTDLTPTPQGEQA
tara:strand:+ start:7007 stop:10696 length:3690 start_codon:yes stop_codon:yes gene_type:complete